MSGIFVGELLTDECYAFEDASIEWVSGEKARFIENHNRPLPTLMWFDLIVEFRKGAAFAAHCAEQGIEIEESSI